MDILIDKTECECLCIIFNKILDEKISLNFFYKYEHKTEINFF